MMYIIDCNPTTSLTHFSLQIVNAPHKSHKARLIKLGDKLYNLRDLLITTPEGWSDDRVQEYFEWAAKVCQEGRIHQVIKGAVIFK